MMDGGKNPQDRQEPFDFCANAPDTPAIAGTQRTEVVLHEISLTVPDKAALCLADLAMIEDSARRRRLAHPFKLISAIGKQLGASFPRVPLRFQPFVGQAPMADGRATLVCTLVACPEHALGADSLDALHLKTRAVVAEMFEDAARIFDGDTAPPVSAKILTPVRMALREIMASGRDSAESLVMRSFHPVDDESRWALTLPPCEPAPPSDPMPLEPRTLIVRVTEVHETGLCCLQPEGQAARLQALLEGGGPGRTAELREEAVALLWMGPVRVRLEGEQWQCPLTRVWTETWRVKEFLDIREDVVFAMRPRRRAIMRILRQRGRFTIPKQSKFEFDEVDGQT